MLLLARLSVIYPQTRSVGGLHKGNLKLSPSSLAIGYNAQEQARVVEYLTELPWADLVSRGYLVETSSGFYKVSDRGTAALSSASFLRISRAALEAATLLHDDLADSEKDFREGKFKDAVRDAFRIYENRLNSIRDRSTDPGLHGKSGTTLAHAFVKSPSVFKFPFPALAPTDPKAVEAYKESLRSLLAGALGFVRNAYDHEPYNLPELDERSALEPLFFASYLLRLLDSSS